MVQTPLLTPLPPSSNLTTRQMLLNHLLLLREQLLFSMVRSSSRWQSFSLRSTIATLKDSPRTKGLRLMTHISVFLPLRSGTMRMWLQQRRYLPSITTRIRVPVYPSGDSLDSRRSRRTSSTCTRRTSKKDYKLLERVVSRSQRSSLPAEIGLNDSMEIIKATIPRTKIKKIITIQVTRKTLMPHLATFLDNQTSMRSHQD